jgi:hypothetical protein
MVVSMGKNADGAATTEMLRVDTVEVEVLVEIVTEVETSCLVVSLQDQ